MKKFTSLASNCDSLVFGKAVHPLSRNGVIIGAGRVLPEINFTLPPIEVSEINRLNILSQYKEMIVGICERCVELEQDQLVVEFELLPQMTIDPKWGGWITSILRETLDDFREKRGLKALIRVTPVDIREFTSPPQKRSGKEMDLLMESFSICAKSGADLLAIESTGGKEVTDKAIIQADIRGVLFGAGSLAARDMEYLWTNICSLANTTKTVPSGDTACGIANTAMVLADRKYIPKVFAAIVRTICACRSLVSYEVGSLGPGKDCGYENPFIKAITGIPMSMEGRSSACAHFSSLGNIAGAYADLWSNESVQNIKLLSGMAPVVSMEQLIYDCRLFDISLKDGCQNILRDWFVKTDAFRDPQAYIFTPDSIIEISKVIISTENYYTRALQTAIKTVEILKKGIEKRELFLNELEIEWLDRIEEDLKSAPTNESQFISEEHKKWSEFVNLSEYGL